MLPSSPTTATTAEPRPLLTIAQFHQRLGGAVGINAIRTAVATGRIRSIQIGERKRVIPTTELHDWLTREANGPN